MNNPWLNLRSEPPLVLDSDKKQIEEFNAKQKEDYKIRLNLTPEPYIGNVNANVIFLSLNPGYDKKDDYFHQENKTFMKLCRENLKGDTPFYFLDESISDSPGYQWWKKRLKLTELIDIKKLRKNICCIEFFPYHSKKFKEMKEYVESQRYSFYLVREAIKRKATIIMLRSERRWLKAVPELEGNYIRLNSRQNVTISSRNMPAGEFEGVVNVLKKS